LVPHSAVNKVGKLYDVFTNVHQDDIFSVSPFVQRKKVDWEFVSIVFINSLWQIIRMKRTFAESKSLKRLNQKKFTKEEYDTIRETKIDLVVTVSNLSTNTVEYKSIHEYSYEEFCNWIWISCNYIPFMSLAKVNGYEYADGGLGCVVPVREAIQRGATEVDVIVLKSENMERNKVLGKNPFSLMIGLFGHLLEQVEKHDILIGKLAARNKDVTLNLYYTP